MKVNTSLLKGMIATVSKCKPNSLLEITSYYNVCAKDKQLIVKATDGVNYIECSGEIKTDEQFEVIVKADQFTKLVNKTSSKEIDLKVKNDVLMFKGNGSYKLEIFTEEDYPSYEFEPYEVYRVKTKQLVNALAVGKNIKSNTLSDGVLFNHLIRDNKVIATDSLKVCCSNISGLDAEILLAPSVVALMDSITDEVCEVNINEDHTDILIKGKGIIIYGALAEGADEYPDVMPIFDNEFDYNGELDKGETLEALDRLRLFINNYDNDLLEITFTNSALILSTINGSVEAVNFIKPIEDDFAEIDYTINNQYLQEILKSMKGQTYKIEFSEGEDIIKLESNEDMFILALADGDE